MKRIIKQPEPDFFATWKRGESEDWQPDWEAFGGAEKHQLKQTLLEEQGYICCYCTDRVTAEQSNIEHLIPRKGREKEKFLELAYDNLCVSCFGGQDDPRPRKLHCNSKKGDKRIPIAPTDEDCESYFRYTLLGEMLPSPDPTKLSQAQQTIATLNLNLPKLIRKRKKAIDGILLYEEGELTPEIVSTLVDGFNERDQHGRFEPFCVVIVFMLQHHFR